MPLKLQTPKRNNMALVEMVMPKMGESVMEGTILGWLKNVGDTIEEDESVLEVATDKVDTEVPAVNAGKLVKQLAQEGDVVQVGAPIAVIEIEGDAPAAETPAAQPSTPAAQPEAQPAPVAEVAAPVANNGAASGRFYSPLVLNICREEGIPMQELEQVPGTGREGRVTKKDILAYVKNRSQQPAPVAAQPATPEAKPAAKPAAPSVKVEDFGPNVEVVEMDRMRKMIASRMVESKRTSPHVTSFVEADVTRVVNWRNKWKKVVEKREGVKLTFTPIFMHAVAKAIQDFPKINASVVGENLVYKKDINLGMAAALPTGNLIVPVVKNANHLNLLGMAKATYDLTQRARNNKLTPDDLANGTYTVSNIGSFGNTLGTPIIMQPQIAILSLGAIIKKPAVVTVDGEDVIAIRHKMYLSHSYDHRVVDGALGGMFVRRVADYLEAWDIDMEI